MVRTVSTRSIERRHLPPEAYGWAGAGQELDESDQRTAERQERAESLYAGSRKRERVDETLLEIEIETAYPEKDE